MTRTVIIGAGHGGFQCAVSLRQEGYGGDIVLIGDEPGLPYQRPPLSKVYLKGGDAAKLVFRPAEFLERNAIDLRSGTVVTQIDRAARQVVTADGTIGYDTLVLATGAEGVIPPVPGIARAMALRNLADAERLRARLQAPMRIVIIGAGFIGLEFAAMARELGHHIEVVELATRPMARAVSPQISAYFSRVHADIGVRIHTNAAVTAVEAAGVTLGDGTVLVADLVLAATGVRARAGLASAAGLAVENGVMVDAGLRSTDPAIFAIGDCARFPDPVSGRHIRLESVQAATDHARHVARAITHSDTAAYMALPWFWSDQGPHKLQIAGLADPDHDSVATESGAVLRFDGDRLTAVETVNDAKRHMKARKILTMDSPPDRSTLAAVGCDILLV